MRYVVFIIIGMFFSSLGFTRVTLITNRISNTWVYTATNHFASPVQILIRLRNEAGREEILHHVIPAHSAQIVLSVSNQRRPSFQFSHELGDPFREPEDVKYWLPLAPGQVVRVTQGYNTRFSHKGKNAYSIDFALVVGTPIYAARDGVVVMVKVDGKRGGNHRSFRRHANFIIIYHNDGTFAHYVHLRYRGSVVRPGEHVSAGQKIGYSGNTGWTRGPHLHFMVTRAGYMDRFSIPTRFYSSSGPLTNLVARQFYLVEHPTSLIATAYLTNTNSFSTNALGEGDGDIGSP